jgi:hypothetical protein
MNEAKNLNHIIGMYVPCRMDTEMSAETAVWRGGKISGKYILRW